MRFTLLLLLSHMLSTHKHVLHTSTVTVSHVINTRACASQTGSQTSLLLVLLSQMLSIHNKNILHKQALLAARPTVSNVINTQQACAAQTGSQSPLLLMSLMLSIHNKHVLHEQVLKTPLLLTTATVSHVINTQQACTPQTGSQTSLPLRAPADLSQILLVS